MQHRPDGGRGQIIIVAALVIAAVFVGLALVLNSGIYAENLSSRETADTDDPLTFTVDADEAVAEAYERTNANGSATAGEAARTFNASVDGWAAARERRAASQGVGVDVERTPHVGWRLEQGEDGDFTPADASETEAWTVAEGTGNVAAFRLNVTRSGLYDASGGLNDTSDEAFRLNVSSGTADWHAYVFQDGADRIVVHVGNPDDEYSDLDDLVGADEACAITADRAVVDLRDETLEDGGSTVDCSPLAFEDDLAGDVTVRFENAYSGSDSRVDGRYGLVVNGSDAVETTRFNESGDASPTATAVVYSASYATRYSGHGMDQTRRGRHAVREETYAG